ncbi:MAG: hypothetical protein Q3983_02305 [Capnocytophaga sp.]|nr:hypothetical protein [Capnocytophaga sp.]
MKQFITIIALMSIFIAFGQIKNVNMKKQKPKNLTECIQMLDKNLKKQDKEYIKTLTEEEFFMESHFTLGMGIRNEWLRSGNPELVKFFLDKDVRHPDDMSAIILTCYYRHLLGKDIDLESQLEAYHKQLEQ